MILPGFWYRHGYSDTWPSQGYDVGMIIMTHDPPRVSIKSRILENQTIPCCIFKNLIRSESSLFFQVLVGKSPGNCQECLKNPTCKQTWVTASLNSGFRVVNSSPPGYIYIYIFGWINYRVVITITIQITSSMKRNISFIKTLNNIGPRIKPCGTPNIFHEFQ